MFCVVPNIQDSSVSALVRLRAGQLDVVPGTSRKYFAIDLVINYAEKNSGGKRSQSVAVSIYLHVVARLIMRRNVPPSPIGFQVLTLN